MRLIRFVLLSMLLAVCAPLSISGPPASAAGSTTITQFVSTWLGRAADYDGAYGAQCVDLFNYYNRDVVGGARIPVSYAYQLYDTYDSNAYTRLAPSTPAQRGDVAIWASNLPYSGGAGHVAVVLSDEASTLTVLQQNANGRQYVTRDSGASKSYLRGYLRPKSLPPEMRGSFDSASAPAPGQLRVTGWAFDEDAKTTPVNVHLYVGGPAGSAGVQGFDLGAANVHRPDVGAAYPGVGDHHGFDRTVDVSRFGDLPIYVYAINVPGTPGGNVLIASRATHVPQPNPFGSLDGLSSPKAGFVRVSGWAADPSAPTTSLAVHVYSGTRFLGSIPAASSRPDVGAAFPGYGNMHGYDATLQAPAGALRVCAYGINIGVGNNNSELGCKTVDVVADVRAPETTIVSAPPASGTASTVTVAFRSDEAPVSYSCQWDGGVWTPCASPVTATVTSGAHTFSVSATDAAGNTDSSPATATFAVTAPAAPLPTPAGITGSVKAVRHKSKIRVDLAPDSADRSYAFSVQRRTAGGWKTVHRSRTRGARDVRVVDLRGGRYRVVVPRQLGVPGFTAKVRLRR